MNYMTSQRYQMSLFEESDVWTLSVEDFRAKLSLLQETDEVLKIQAVAKVSDGFNLNVKDDEADAILIGSYFVNQGREFGELESHKIS